MHVLFGTLSFLTLEVPNCSKGTSTAEIQQTLLSNRLSRYPRRKRLPYSAMKQMNKDPRSSYSSDYSDSQHARTNASQRAPHAHTHILQIAHTHPSKMAPLHAR